MPMTRRDRLISRLQVELNTLFAVAARGDWEAAGRVQQNAAMTLAALRDEDAPATSPGGEIVRGPWWRTVH